MMWADRIALACLELLLIATSLLVAVTFFSSAPVTESVYGWLVGSAILVIFPLWLVLRIAERRGYGRSRKALRKDKKWPAP